MHMFIYLKLGEERAEAPGPIEEIDGVVLTGPVVVDGGGCGPHGLGPSYGLFASLHVRKATPHVSLSLSLSFS